MKEVEETRLPEIPGGAVPPYPGGTDVGPSRPLFPGLDDYPTCPIAPETPII
jgi:hypothetical protein